MVERVFLGWQRPFLKLAVPWLLARREELPGMLVVVPTAQSGRRLREALAEEAGALLSPKVVTPGAFLKSADETAAPDWIEQLAWTDVLEEVTDWTAYEALFPVPPDDTGWAAGIAREMMALRRTLQENGLLLGSAARKLGETVEAGRWAALAALEDLVEARLRAAGLRSRSRVLAAGLKMPPGVTRVVLAGVPEIPPVAERFLTNWPGSVTALIGAPESEAELFSSLGTPTEKWTECPLPWPDTVKVAADPRQQAAEALRLAADAQTPPGTLALGSADTEAGDELARTFTRAGWIAFHPATKPVTGGLARWFKVWRVFLADPTLATMADLLPLPETGVLVGHRRAQKARRLAELRDKWMVNRTEELLRRVAGETFRDEMDKATAEEVCEAASKLETLRGRLSGGDFTHATLGLLDRLGRTSPEAGETAEQMSEWLRDAGGVIRESRRDAGFWIDLMLSEIPPSPPLPPAGRVLDVQGWLELFHEPGSHLILCGMNDGKVPARGGGEPWLSEAARKKLGLIRDTDRAARDAYLYQAMVEARKDGGRVDVICGKNGAGGDTLLPSRILLAAEREELPARVMELFKEVEPPEAGLRWEADWQWQPPASDPPKRLNVTSLGDYLQCPFRYYLKYVLKMQTPEPTRAEWNARDFGTVAHEVLERWGRDLEARDHRKPEALHAWFSHELDVVVKEWFGKRVPLAVRIQTESLRQRFVWLARVQGINREEGWEVVDVERKVEIPVGEALIVAKIDRIDQHRETGRLRVLDYKTGKVDTVEKAHRRKITSNNPAPAHLGVDGPAIHGGMEKGKPVEYVWTNLQLPLYALALVKRGVVKSGEEAPLPCYFTVRSTESEIGIQEWEGFSMEEVDSAKACADWIAAKIEEGVFWPPAEKVTYDDFAELAAGRSFAEMFAEPGGK